MNLTNTFQVCNFWFRSFCCVVTFGLLPANFTFAEPPAITALTPAGGQRGQRVEVTVQGKLGTPPLSFWSDRTELRAEFPEKPEKTFTLIIPETAHPGMALLRVYNAEGASTLRPFEIGVLPEIPEKEPNDSLEQSQSLDASRVLINGVLDKSGDVDSYSLQLEQGQTLVAAMSANTTLGSPLDGVLQIVSPSGFVLEQNDDDQGNDPQLVFTVPESGVYQVRAFGFPAAPNSTVRFSGAADWIYRLTLTTGPWVDHLQPLAISAETDSSAEVFGWNLPEQSRSISLNRTPGLSEVLVPEAANVAGIETVSHQSVVEPSADAPAIAAFPVSVSGQIANPGETDSLRIAGQKGQPLSCQVQARAIGSLLDPVLRLIDSDGKQLVESDDASRGVLDTTLNYTPKADGEFVLQVRDRFEHGSMRHFYRLTIAPPEKKYTLSIAADSFKVEREKPLEIPVTVTRDKGFDAQVKIRIEGLPESLSVEPAVSEPKGDSSKKVTLKIEAGNGEPFTGPIRIIGTSDGETVSTTEAAIAVAGTARSSSLLWLTIPAAKKDEPESDNQTGK